MNTITISKSEGKQPNKLCKFKCLCFCKQGFAGKLCVATKPADRRTNCQTKWDTAVSRHASTNLIARTVFRCVIVPGWRSRLPIRDRGCERFATPIRGADECRWSGEPRKSSRCWCWRRWFGSDSNRKGESKHIFYLAKTFLFISTLVTRFLAFSVLRATHVSGCVRRVLEALSRDSMCARLLPSKWRLWAPSSLKFRLRNLDPPRAVMRRR